MKQLPEPDDVLSITSARTRAEAAFQRYAALARQGRAPSTATFLAGEEPEVAEELARILHDFHTLRGSLSGTAEALVAGRSIGPYRLVREIGRGGAGVVWEAEQEAPRRRVALKLLHPHLVLSAVAVQRFHNEAEAAGRVAHAGVVAIHAVGEADGIHWIAEELVPGGLSLADAIAELRDRGALPEGHFRAAAELFRHAALALHAAHEQGVLHRDVKPANVLIGPDGRPKVADFGLARIGAEPGLTRTGELAGTPYYMSPEATGDARLLVDARSDQFSLGVALYEALTLERPFRGTSLQQIVASIQRDDPVDPRKLHGALPSDLATIVLKMLEKPPERRYASLSAVAADLGRFLANEPIAARPLGVVGRLQRWCRRHPGRAAAAFSGGVAVVAAVLLAVAYVRVERDRDRLLESTRLSGRAIDLMDPWDEGQPVEQAVAVAREMLEFAATGSADEIEWLPLVLGGAQLLAANGEHEEAAQALANAEGRMLRSKSPAIRRFELLEVRIRIAEELDAFEDTRKLLKDAIELVRSDAELTSRKGLLDRLLGSLAICYRREEWLAGLEVLEKEYGKPRDFLERILEDVRHDPASTPRSLERALFDAGRARYYDDNPQGAVEAFKSAHDLALRTRGLASRREIEIDFWHWSSAERLKSKESRRDAPGEFDRLAARAFEALGPEDPLVVRIEWKRAVARFEALDNEENATVADWVMLEHELRGAVTNLELRLGPEHIDSLKANTGLAVVLGNRGGKLGRSEMLEEAARIDRKTLSIWESQYSPSHWAAITTKNHLASCLMKGARLEEAAGLLEPCVDAWFARKYAMPYEPDSVLLLAGLYEDLDRPTDAIKLLRQGVQELDHERLEALPVAQLWCLMHRCTALLGLAREEAPVELVRRAHERLATLDPERMRKFETMLRIRTAQGRGDAADLRAMLAEDPERSRAYVLLVLARVHEANGQHDEAMQAARDAEAASPLTDSTHWAAWRFQLPSKR